MEHLLWGNYYASWTIWTKWWLRCGNYLQGAPIKEIWKVLKNPAWNWLVWLWKRRQASCQEAPRSTCSWMKTTSNLSCIQIVANSIQCHHPFNSLLKYKPKCLHILHDSNSSTPPSLTHTHTYTTTYNLKQKYYHKYKSPVLKLTGTEGWRFQDQTEVYNKPLSPSKRKDIDR